MKWAALTMLVVSVLLVGGAITRAKDSSAALQAVQAGIVLAFMTFTVLSMFGQHL